MSSGNAKAVGFCLFETRSAAQNAINELDGKPWPGSAQPTLRVRFADDSSKKVSDRHCSENFYEDTPFTVLMVLSELEILCCCLGSELVVLWVCDL